MSLTVRKRPTTPIIDTSTSYQATNSGGSGSGINTFTKVAHGLNTDDIIYVYDSFQRATGFWQINKISADQFQLYEYTAGASDFLSKAAVQTINYYKCTLTTGSWNSIHLPIVYKLKSSLFPINSDDTARAITTFTNYNGYTYIVAAGDIKTTGTASTLEQVVLSGTSVDGIYKIIAWLSDTNFVINLPYSAGNVLSSGTVQYYYGNYHVRVQVWAGISIFPINWYTAVENVAELRITPDSNGIVTININEILKKKIKPINNDWQEAMPYNPNAWCEFYIKYAESYDDSNMYTVSEYVSAYIDDSGSFTGRALNAKLPFKSRYAGSMAEYEGISLGASSVPTSQRKKWLTAMSQPNLFPGKAFDVSYIRSSDGGYVKRDLYRYNGAGNYSLITSIIDQELDNGGGAIYEQTVIRKSITQSGNLEDRIDLTLINASSKELSQTLTIYVNTQCGRSDFYLCWLNYLGGFDYWNFKGAKKYTIDLVESQTQEKNIFNTWPKSYGEFGDSIKQQTVRRTQNVIEVISQNLTSTQIDDLKAILSSPLVQLVTSAYDRRTVIVDPASMVVKEDRPKRLFTFAFKVRYTDELPSQSL